MGMPIFITLNKGIDGLGKGTFACDGLSDDQGVDVVGAFIGEDGLEIVGVPNDGIFKGDAVRAKHGAGFACRPDSFTHVVAFGNRDLYGM